MTDIRADDPAYDEPEEDRLPWLEPVEEEERGPSPLKLVLAVIVGLVAIGVVVGGLFWLGTRGQEEATGELIASPGAYKMPAPEPGGMKVDERGSTQIAASEGDEPTATLNRGAAPETPVTQPQQPAPQRQPLPQTEQAKAAPRPETQAQRPAPAQRRLTGPTIQVGAFPSAEAAQGEWARLTRRHPYLAGLDHAVMTYQRGGQTFYRLRAAGAEAPAICRRLRAADQPCLEVND